MLPNIAYDWPVITGQQLRDARLKAGYTSQEQLAKALGVSTRTVTDWENNHVSTRGEGKVRRLLWPGALPLSTFDDWELLTELGRRLAARRQELMELSENTPQDSDEPDTILPEDPGTFTSRRGGR